MCNLQWEQLYRLTTSHCAEHFNLFHSTLLDLVDEYFPTHVVKHWPSNCRWVSEAFRSLVRKSQQALKSKHLVLYRVYRNKVNPVREKTTEVPSTERGSVTSVRTTHSSGGKT